MAGLAVGLVASLLHAFVVEFVVWSERHRSIDVHGHSGGSVAGGVICLLCSCAARDKVDPLVALRMD